MVEPKSAAEEEGKLEPVTPEEQEGLKKILKCYNFCKVCSGGTICKEGWAHKARVGHAMRAWGRSGTQPELQGKA